MADTVFGQVCTRLNRPALLKRTGTICGLGGKTLDVRGETELLVPDAGPINVMVTRCLPHQILLGSDAIAAGRGVMDYDRGIFHWYGQDYTLDSYPDCAPQADAVHVSETSGHDVIDRVIEEYNDVFSHGEGATALGQCDLIPFTIDTPHSSETISHPSTQAKGS